MGNADSAPHQQCSALVMSGEESVAFDAVWAKHSVHDETHLSAKALLEATTPSSLPVDAELIFDLFDFLQCPGREAWKRAVDSVVYDMPQREFWRRFIAFYTRSDKCIFSAIAYACGGEHWNCSNKSCPLCSALRGISAAQAYSWGTSSMPRLFSSIKALLRFRLLGDATKYMALSVPNLQSSLPSVIPFALSMAFEEEWANGTLLFSTDLHGLSFEAMAAKITGYAGPTMIVVESPGGSIFAGYTTYQWKQEGAFYGEGDSCLISFLPTFHCYRRTSRARNYMYLNVKKSAVAKGLGMGGADSHPRLWLDNELEACRGSQYGLTYQAGKLHSSEESFAPSNIKVWGYGSAEALERQARIKAVQDRVTANMRKVDKSAFAESAFDREFLLGKTFGASEKR